MRSPSAKSVRSSKCEVRPTCDVRTSHSGLRTSHFEPDFALRTSNGLRTSHFGLRTCFYAVDKTEAGLRRHLHRRAGGRGPERAAADVADARAAAAEPAAGRADRDDDLPPRAGGGEERGDGVPGSAARRRRPGLARVGALFRGRRLCGDRRPVGRDRRAQRSFAGRRAAAGRRRPGIAHRGERRHPAALRVSDRSHARMAAAAAPWRHAVRRDARRAVHAPHPPEPD